MRLHPALLAAPLLLAAQTPASPPREGLSYGTILYGEPALVDTVRPAVVELRAGAVIAEQRAEIMGARMVLDRATRVGAPFNHNLPAGAAFRLYRTAGGERWCETGIPGVVYRPPLDEGGAMYPGTCLLDADGDGAFEAVRMLPYAPARPVRTMPITPVRLLPAPPVTDSRLAPLRVFKRLRIGAVDGDRVELIMDYKWVSPGRPEPDYDPQTADRSTIVVRPGMTLSVDGLGLHFSGRSGLWRMEPDGAFRPWVVLAPDNASLRIGPWNFGPNED